MVRGRTPQLLWHNIAIYSPRSCPIYEPEPIVILRVHARRTMPEHTHATCPNDAQTPARDTPSNPMHDVDRDVDRDLAISRSRSRSSSIVVVVDRRHTIYTHSLDTHSHAYTTAHAPRAPRRPDGPRVRQRRSRDTRVCVRVLGASKRPSRRRRRRREPTDRPTDRPTRIGRWISRARARDYRYSTTRVATVERTRTHRALSFARSVRPWYIYTRTRTKHAR